VQIPWALTGTGSVTNIHGVGYGLRLTGSILAKIYTGKITTWGNGAITRINKHYAKALRRRAGSRRSTARTARVTPTCSSTSSLRPAWQLARRLRHGLGRLYRRR